MLFLFGRVKNGFKGFDFRLYNFFLKLSFRSLLVLFLLFILKNFMGLFLDLLREFDVFGELIVFRLLFLGKNFSS